MRKIILIITAISILSLISSSVEAKRGGAPVVEPLVYKGMKFIAPNTPQKMGYVEAWDIKTNQKVWEKKVYSVSINTKMEGDVQWIFISSLKIEDGKLIVTDERGKEYKIDIPKSMLSEEIKSLQRFDKSSPLTLTIKSDKQAYEVGEEIKLEATIKNNYDKEMIVFWSHKKPVILTDEMGVYIVALHIQSPADETLYIKPKKSITRTVTIILDEKMKPIKGRIRIQLEYNTQNVILNYKHRVDQDIFIDTLTSNTITIEVKEQNKPVQNPTSSGIDRILDEHERYVNKYERLLKAANSSAEFIPIILQFEKEDTAWQEKYREEINKSGHTWSKEKWLEISNRIQKNLNRITAVAQSKPFKTCPRAR